MAKASEITVLETGDYAAWITQLKDNRARLIVESRIARLRLGNIGDAKTVGEGVTELRIDHGPGYRVYFTRIGRVVVVLLCGGDKSSQAKDIRLAKQLAASAREMIRDA